MAAFPDKPVQFIVPYPPGGSNDILARALGKKLAEGLGKPVLIDNRAGAGGSIGADLAAKAAPDGHTIAIVSSSFTTNAAVQARLPFDPVKSFTPVALVGRGPLVLVVSNGVPAKTAQEFFALAKSRPGKLNYGSSGPGSINQFAAELLKSAAGIDLAHVPYKGVAPATTDVIGGHVDALVASVPSVMQHVRSGKLRGLGVTTLAASPAAPGLAPLAAAGATGYDVELWWGVVAPAGLAPAVLSRLNSGINNALAGSEMKDFLLKEGAEAAPMTPQAFGALIASELERWKKVAAVSGIKAE
ncbi:MAG: tripartite tricarboxylate transporter substrate binding protein [Burkholderiales bacterium]